MIGWLIALGILVLIAILPVGASVIYDEDGLLLRLLLGMVKIRLYPKKNKKDKKDNKKKKQSKQSQEEKKKKTGKSKEKSGGKLTDFIPLVKIGFHFLNSFRKKLRLKQLILKLTLAGGDPCDLAVKYGKAWAAVGNAMPILERVFVIKKRDIQVQCNFEASENRIYARLDVTITVGRIIGIAVKYGVKALIAFVKISNKRKGGKKMSKNLPNMLDTTIAKIREMVNANSVVGEPVVTADGTTIIPVSKISVGLAGGGSDFVSKNVNRQDNPFGGGAGAGVQVTPLAFLIIKEGSVRMIPVAVPANTTADRIVEMVPDTLDKIVAFVDSRAEKKAES